MADVDIYDVIKFLRIPNFYNDWVTLSFSGQSPLWFSNKNKKNEKKKQKNQFLTNKPQSPIIYPPLDNASLIKSVVVL